MRYSITHKDANDAGRSYMQSNNLVIFVVMSAIIGGAWMERDTLKKYWDSYVNPPSQAHYKQQAITVYRLLILKSQQSIQVR